MDILLRNAHWLKTTATSEHTDFLPISIHRTVTDFSYLPDVLLGCSERQTSHMYMMTRGADVIGTRFCSIASIASSSTTTTISPVTT